MTIRIVPSSSALRALCIASLVQAPTAALGRQCLRASCPPNTSTHIRSASSPPRTHDRGPKSDEINQTDFTTADIYSRTSAPSNAIDACLEDGFHLNNGVKITGGNGLLLVGGEAFTWRPWGHTHNESLVNNRGQWAIPQENMEIAWGLLQLVWPKPGQ